MRGSPNVIIRAWRKFHPETENGKSSVANQIDTRVAIIRAAENISKTQGIAKLTLDQVAKDAGISKGGLLYHFPNKNALIEGMLQYSLEAFNLFIDDYTKKDKAPGAWARGFIKGTFPSRNTATKTKAASASSVVVSAGLNPALLKSYIAQQEEWIPRLIADGLDEMTANLIRFAVDGVWLNEALGIKPLTAKAQQRFVDYLLSLTYTDKTPGKQG
ncbi:TetR/AcrR family transcriptional regulator [Pseudomonas sp. S 311-6]|nr:TetR/AcrR family transcriptional regulator [Pseudomonas sp. S 311-6]